MPSFIAHPGIDPGVQEIRHQVGGQDAHGHHQHQPQGHGPVAGGHRIDEQEANTRPGEDGFDDHRAGEQEPDSGADDSDQRQGCVGKGVPVEDLPSG